MVAIAAEVEVGVVVVAASTAGPDRCISATTMPLANTTDEEATHRRARRAGWARRWLRVRAALRLSCADASFIPTSRLVIGDEARETNVKKK